MALKGLLRVLILSVFAPLLSATEFGDNPLNIFPSGALLEDSSGQLTIEDVMALDSDAWDSTETQDFSVSLSDSDFWFHVVIDELDLTQEPYVLVAKMPLQDYIDVWFYDQNNRLLAMHETGDRRPFSSRNIESRFFAFNLPNERLDQLKIFIRFSTHDGMFEPGELFIEKQTTYSEELQVQYLVYGFLYGGMFILGLYNLFLFVSHRDRQFLLYSFFILSYFIYNFTLRGFSGQFLFPDDPGFANQFKAISLTFTYFSIFLFLSGVLSLKKYYPIRHRIYSLNAYFLIVPFTLAVLDQYALFYRVIIIPALITLLGVIYFSLLGSLRGDRTSKILLIAWSVLATGGILFALKAMGVVEPNLFILYSIDIGSTIESLILAFALGDKLNRLRDMNDAANAELIRNQRESNLKMEQTVKERTEQLMIARDEAESANEKKNIFLANISHEIRTPMNGVLGMIKVLKRTEITKQQKEYIDLIEHSGNRMVILLNDLLDITLIQEKIKPDSQHLSVKRLCKQVVESFSEAALSKKLELSLTMPENIPDVVGDHKLIEQLLSNLVSNAIKYTETGSVEVLVASTRPEPGKAAIKFMVCDTGIGIPEELKQRVFERFYQVDESFSRTEEGMGLGLAICKEIATALGSRLELESVAGQGSQFSFDLILPVSDLSDDLDAQQETLGIPRSLRVLLVEDEYVGRLAVRSLLEDERHEVVEVHNGQEALDVLEKDNAFDVVLMDVHMPIMDGLEATQKIRQNPKREISELLIVGLTASANSREKTTFLNAGMNEIVSKPFDLGKLGLAIRANLK